MNVSNEKLVLVCDKCKRACCYYGFFMCDDARAAGVVVMTVGALRKLKLEHSDYWTNQTFMEVYGTAKPDFSREPGHPTYEKRPFLPDLRTGSPTTTEPSPGGDRRDGNDEQHELLQVPEYSTGPRRLLRPYG